MEPRQGLNPVPNRIYTQEAITCIKNTKPQEFEMHESTTFGEEARNKMDKQKREAEKGAFQMYICAVLNSKGGALIWNITNTDYSFNEHDISQDLEQCLNTLIYPVIFSAELHSLSSLLMLIQ
uniref:Schlafen AlbA-2 domain-containing protein n=1 Tax=Electrophorus electricus TaxID=8005 RepID=A0A4W4E2E5_ELEEL